MSAPFSMAINTPSRPTGLLPVPLRVALAAYQLAAAGWVLFYNSDTLFLPNREDLPERVLTISLITLSLLAGFYLLRKPQLGRTFTVLNQLPQLVAFASPVFTLIAHLGLSASIGLYGIEDLDDPGRRTMGADYTWQWGHTTDLAIGRPHLDHPGYMITLNIVAALILLTALFCRQKATQKTL